MDFILQKINGLLSLGWSSDAVVRCEVHIGVGIVGYFNGIRERWPGCKVPSGLLLKDLQNKLFRRWKECYFIEVSETHVTFWDGRCKGGKQAENGNKADEASSINDSTIVRSSQTGASFMLISLHSQCIVFI